MRLLIGDPQTGFSPGRTSDENVSSVRGTIHAVNNQRPDDGGVMVLLDNTKAFDRLQHDFMFRTLEAFNLPPCLVDAVRTLYADAETVMKTNGEVSPDAFKCLSGVKQGCPLSPLLYNLVQEVQLRMIRQDQSIVGISIPDADGRTAPSALRGRSPELKERGLVDDTMVALASANSIPALIRVLDRFEAMSHNRMNLSKTVCILLGDERGFDVNGSSLAGQLLRRRGLTRTYDISEGRDDTLPDKWHGVILGNEAGAEKVWRDACDEAQRAAEAQQACAMPYGSRGRQVLAQGKIMGKVNAALRLTVPHSDRAVEDGLAAIQKHADRTVFGKRHWLTLAAAKQPRDCMGVGHLDVKAATQAGWLKPLLAAAGQTQDQRPFKSYYCAYAREAYPALGMGRELLTLNLGFHRVVALPPEAIPGEAKHAFAAYATLPPLTYLEPDEDSGCVPRERMRYEELVRQPLLLNPLLESEPRRRRATAKEEDECLWWAQHGLKRIGDVLTADGKRVLTYTELVSRHAGLADDQMPAPRLRAMHTAIVANLNRWRKTLAKGPPKVIRRGQFRWGPSGEVLRVTSTPATGAAATSAKLYEEQPHTGLLAATDQTRDLPAAPTDSEPCPVICMECEDSDWDADSDSDSDDEPYSTPEKVEEALGHQFRHALLAPWAMQPTPDPRLLGWRRPATMTPARDVCLAYASGKDVRLTLIALAYAEPRVFAQGGRLASLLAGLSQEQRRRRLAAIAGGMKHSVIPQEESHHLYVTVHHGHLQGQVKCRGDKGQCARCLQRGDRHEERVMHESYMSALRSRDLRHVCRTHTCTGSFRARGGSACVRVRLAPRCSHSRAGVDCVGTFSLGPAV